MTTERYRVMIRLCLLQNTDCLINIVYLVLGVNSAKLFLCCRQQNLADV